MGMNTQTAIVSLLLFPLLSTGLAAQDLGLRAAATTQSMFASVDGAARDSCVVLVLGMSATPTRLPDGQVLGISPDLLADFAIADGRNPTAVHVRFASALPRGFTFYAQAVSIDLTLALNAQQFDLSQVETVVVR